MAARLVAVVQADAGRSVAQGEAQAVPCKLLDRGQDGPCGRVVWRSGTRRSGSDACLCPCLGGSAATATTGRSSPCVAHRHLLACLVGPLLSGLREESAPVSLLLCSARDSPQNSYYVMLQALRDKTHKTSETICIRHSIYCVIMIKARLLSWNVGSGALFIRSCFDFGFGSLPVLGKSLRKYPVGMNISVNWTAVSCIVALLLGLWNVVHSWIYEKQQRKRELRDRALDAAIRLNSAALRRQYTKDRELRIALAGEVTGFVMLITSCGYPVNYDVFESFPYNPDAVIDELSRLVEEIVSSAV